MTKFGRLGRLLASASAVALLGVGLFGSAASAEPTPAPLPGNIEGESGSLTIHKYAGKMGSDRDDGHPNDDVQGEPLEGVEFKIYPVVTDDANENPIDLTTPEGWDLIAGLAAPSLPEGYKLGTPFTVTTGNDGSVSQSLNFGLYYVEESDSGPHNIVSKVVPFFVTVPYPSNGAWIYAVHVYPKNIVDNNEPVKTVENPGPGYVPGDTVTWTVSKELPALQDGEAFSSLVFTDTFDDRLSITAGDVSVESSREDVTLVAEDYSVAVDGQKVTVTFTEAGLAKLDGGDTITVTYQTTVREGLSGEDLAEIPNTAQVSVNDVEQESNTVAVYYGAIQVTKTNKQAAPLAGAEFDIYATDADGIKTGDALNDEPLVTGADGKFSAPYWVWVGTSASDTAKYVLVETKAPAGYVTPTGDDAEWTVTVTAGENKVVVIDQLVENTQHTGPDLPLTGAQGTLLLTLIGVGLIGVGAAVVGIRRARTNR